MTRTRAIAVHLVIIISLSGYAYGYNLITSVKYDIEAEIKQTIKRTVNSFPAIINSILTKRDEELFTNGTLMEDVHMPIDALITKYGYTVEKHEVVTDDGYIITMFRIPSHGEPVFLMHGLMMSADDWVTAGPRSGIAYQLAAEGYDVWLGNTRGNKHGKRHERLSPDTPKFWDFSWGEIGYDDVPTMIDYVLNKTGASSLFYVCHSQGCTVFFVMASERPEYNDKIKLMVGLGPATAVPNIKSPVVLFIKYFTLLHPELLINLLKQFGLYEFVPRYKLIDSVVNALCGNIDLARMICANLVFLIGGFNHDQLNITNLPVMFSHMPTSASIKQLEHYAQTINSRKFQKFDYGPTENLKLYGRVSPPEYRLESVSAPVALFYSENDWLTTTADVMIAARRLANVVDMYRVPDKNFNHLDFLFAKDIRKLILPRLLNLIREYT